MKKHFDFIKGYLEGANCTAANACLEELQKIEDAVESLDKHQRLVRAVHPPTMAFWPEWDVDTEARAIREHWMAEGREEKRLPPTDTLKLDPARNPAGKATTRIADWSLYPCGRYRKHGDHSAEAFRDDHLIPALEKHECVEIDMNGPLAFGSSWLEECFGGLVRAGYSAKELEARLTVVGGRVIDHIQVWSFIEEADQ